MKVTIVREYDESGRMTSETITTEGEQIELPGVAPRGGSVYPAAMCTCGVWMGVVPPPPCPIHGATRFPTITCQAVQQ